LGGASPSDSSRVASPADWGPLVARRVPRSITSPSVERLAANASRADQRAAPRSQRIRSIRALSLVRVGRSRPIVGSRAEATLARAPRARQRGSFRQAGAGRRWWSACASGSTSSSHGRCVAARPAPQRQRSAFKAHVVADVTAKAAGPRAGSLSLPAMPALLDTVATCPNRPHKKKEPPKKQNTFTYAAARAPAIRLTRWTCRRRSCPGAADALA